MIDDQYHPNLKFMSTFVKEFMDEMVKLEKKS
jgi:hypothetical protein